MSSFVAAYRPGRGLLHRLPAGPKLAGLLVASLAIVLLRGIGWSLVALALGLLLALVARVDLPVLWRATRGLLVAAVLVSLLQWWVDGPAKATETLLDLVALALLGLAVTVTTPVNAILDTLVRVVRPLRPLGVDPDRVALAVGLAVQALPGTYALALETRDAARARGLRTPRAYLTPFVIRVVARAHETGAALHARGIGDD